MKTKRLLSVLFLSCLLPSAALAGVWQDPETKVNYSYTVGENEAYVWKLEKEVSGHVSILSEIYVDGKTYTVTSIRDYAFRSCSGLTSVTIPNSVTSIGYRAFSGCSSLTSVTIPNSVTSIGDYAFEGCSGLTSVKIGNGVTRIERYTFSGCTSLTSVSIGNSVTSIGWYAFSGCSGLTSVTIPNSVTSIGGGAFNGTGWYNNQPNGILYLDNWLIGYKGEQPTGELLISEGTRGIADYAFEGCSGLTSVTIPNSVTSIGSGAFQGCI